MILVHSFQRLFEVKTNYSQISVNQNINLLTHSLFRDAQDLGIIIFAQSPFTIF